VDISSLVGQAPLLADLATNKVLKTVELVEVTQNDQTVYDLKLSNALLFMVQSSAAFPGVETSLGFNFQKVSLTDHGVTSEGGLGSAQTVALHSHPAA
jgi:hypothetical protein